MIHTLAIEPSAAPWVACPTVDVLAKLTDAAGSPEGRPVLVAVDGRQGGGKTTTAARLAEQAPGSIVVHTDDVAWWESFFGWDHLMSEGILQPLRRGEAVDYRPPAWQQRGREGSIVVPASAPVVFIEGVGSSRRSLAASFDARAWIQSDWQEANRRGIEREGGGKDETNFWWEWDAEEQPFLADDRPWERADLIICGTPALAGVAHEPATDLLVGGCSRSQVRPHT